MPAPTASPVFQKLAYAITPEQERELVDSGEVRQFRVSAASPPPSVRTVRMQKPYACPRPRPSRPPLRSALQATRLPSFPEQTLRHACMPSEDPCTDGGRAVGRMRNLWRKRKQRGTGWGGALEVDSEQTLHEGGREEGGLKQLRALPSRVGGGAGGALMAPDLREAQPAADSWGGGSRGRGGATSGLWQDWGHPSLAFLVPCVPTS